MQAFGKQPYYTRVALLGVGLFLFMAALIAVPVAIFFPEEIMFPVIIAVIALIVGAIVFFVRPWGLVLAVIGGLLGLMFTTQGIALSLSTPESLLDFAFPIVLIPGSIMMIGGGVAGLVQHFRHESSTAHPTLTNVLRGSVAVIGLLLVGSALLTAVNIGGASAEERQGAPVVRAKASEFETTAVSATRGGKVYVENDDPILHTFTIQALGIDVKLGPGTGKVVSLEEVPAGEYVFYCRVTGHESMDGVLTVK